MFFPFFVLYFNPQLYVNMKRKLLILSTFFATVFSFAQSSYTFSVSNEPYQNLTGSTSLNEGEIWDDPEYSIPLGFDFQISTHTFDTIFIVDWSVGGELSSSQNETGILPLLAPIAQDLIDLGFSEESSQSNISYITEGTPGSRILKIEWNNAGFFDDDTTTDFINFQVWLYEGANSIEYRYGPNAINNPSGSYENETGPIVALQPSVDIEEGLIDDAYVLSEDPSDPMLTIVAPGEEYDGGFLVGTIPEGTVYTFNPATLASEEFKENTFVVYPNPVSNVLYILSDEALFNTKLYNTLGQEVPLKKGNNQSYDVSALSSGIYLLKITTESGSIVKRIVKN